MENTNGKIFFHGKKNHLFSVFEEMKSNFSFSGLNLPVVPLCLNLQDPQGSSVLESCSEEDKYT